MRNRDYGFGYYHVFRCLDPWGYSQTSTRRTGDKVPAGVSINHWAREATLEK